VRSTLDRVRSHDDSGACLVARVPQQRPGQNKRPYLEEGISYLRQAPVSKDSTALTQAQLETVIARLELRTLLGDLAGESQAKLVGIQAEIDQERIRIRNLELLRQWAEKTELIFESLNLAGKVIRRNEEPYSPTSRTGWPRD